MIEVRKYFWSKIFEIKNFRFFRSHFSYIFSMKIFDIFEIGKFSKIFTQNYMIMTNFEIENFELQSSLTF